MSRIAITRISACGALGNSLDELVDALFNNRIGIRAPHDLEQPPKNDVGVGEVPLALEDRGASRAEALLARTVDALLTTEDRTSIHHSPTRWGMVIGTTLAGMRHCAVGVRAENAGRVREAQTQYARSCASSVLSHALLNVGITGPTITVSCACASALTAVAHACTLLHARGVDAVIAGGYDPISEFAFGGFSALQLIAEGPLSPFAKDRDGMKLGEGAALFVLRRLEDLSTHDHANVRGIIEATAESSDAHHLTQPHPQGFGARRALSAVLKNSCDQEPSAPDLIVAHATGTLSNDSAEYEAYCATLGTALAATPVVALKSRLGHPLGAAGVLELACAIGCAERGFIPTTAGRGRDRDAFAQLDLVEGEPRGASPQTIAVLSAGFGGANAALRVTRGELARQRACDINATPRATDRAARKSSIMITGAGAVSPAGRGVDALSALAHQGGVWPAFSEDTLTALLDRTKSRRLALLPRLMIAAVRDLIETTSLSADELRETPLIAANWCGTADYTDRYYRDLVRSGIDLANPMLFAESVPNIGSAHCSLAFGIEAPALSVIGRRTAAIEALCLAVARINTGVWTRAIVVAGEEAHPTVERVLARGIGRRIDLRSSAIAILLERADAVERVESTCSVGIDTILGATRPLDPLAAAAALRAQLIQFRPECARVQTTSSPFDQPLYQCFEEPFAAEIMQQFERLPRIQLAELGATMPLAALIASRSAADPNTARWLCCSDPHGASWAIMTHRRILAQ